MRKRREDPDARFKHWSEGDCAATIGVTYRHFCRLVQAGVFPALPRNQKGRDIREVVAAWGRYLANQKVPDDIRASRKRREAAEAKIKELKALELDRGLVEIKEVERVFAGAIQLIASQLEGAAGRLAGQVAALDEPAACRAVLLRELRRIRTAAAAELEALADREDRRSDPPAAA